MSCNNTRKDETLTLEGRLACGDHLEGASTTRTGALPAVSLVYVSPAEVETPRRIQRRPLDARLVRQLVAALTRLQQTTLA